MTDHDQQLTRRDISDAVTDLGWRYVLGAVRTCVRVGSIEEAVEVARSAARAAGDDGASFSADLRGDCAVLTVKSPTFPSVTRREVDLVGRVSAAVRDLGLTAEPAGGASDTRTVQTLEIAIDALDIAAVRPFWKAVLGYVDAGETTESDDPVVDPLGQGPALWFQQMDAPRPQRNRIHLDISVPHDDARARVQAAVSAGGRILSDDDAPSFWVLADAEGNEACVTTWQGRDA